MIHQYQKIRDFEEISIFKNEKREVLPHNDVRPALKNFFRELFDFEINSEKNQFETPNAVENYKTYQTKFIIFEIFKDLIYFAVGHLL